jgi:hypothetical protein
MKRYAGTTEQFRTDARMHRIAEKLTAEYTTHNHSVFYDTDAVALTAVSSGLPRSSDREWLSNLIGLRN